MNIGHLSEFCINLSLLLESGIHLLDALEILSGEINHKDRKRRREVEEIQCSVREGKNLASAMRRCGKKQAESISRVLSDMEGRGNLSAVLRILGSSLSEKRNFRRKIVLHLSYPVFLLLLCFLLLIVINILVPAFHSEEFARRTGSDRIGGFLIFIGIAGIFCILVYPPLRTYCLQRAACLPFIRTWVTDRSLLLFCRVFLLCLESGNTVTSAFLIAAKAGGFSLINEDLDHILRELEAGKGILSLHESAIGHSYRKRQGLKLPDYFFRWFTLGFKSARMHSAFQGMEKYIEMRVQRQESLILKSCEPIGILIVGFVFLSILLNRFLPYYQSIGGL